MDSDFPTESAVHFPLLMGTCIQMQLRADEDDCNGNGNGNGNGIGDGYDCTRRT
jgi:hypothetical protein